MSGRDVLVVEDDTDLRESLSQALRDHGFGVTPATNGQEALDLLHAGARPSRSSSST
jgi:CheY-like chemotaxis protein